MWLVFIKFIKQASNGTIEGTVRSFEEGLSKEI